MHDNALVTILKALRLAHVNISIHLTVQESIGDVNRAHVEVLNGSGGKDDLNAGHTNGGSKHFDKIIAWMLREALGNKSSLVVLNGAVSIALDLEYPSAANSSAVWREINDFPSAVLDLCIVLLLNSSVPLIHVRALHGLRISRRL